MISYCPVKVNVAPVGVWAQHFLLPTKTGQCRRDLLGVVVSQTEQVLHESTQKMSFNPKKFKVDVRLLHRHLEKSYREQIGFVSTSGPYPLRHRLRRDRHPASLDDRC